MDKSLTELIKISRQVGKDPNLTCGASGNTSVKTADGRFMFVKASGTAIKDMSIKKGWCKIDLKKVRGIIKDEKLAKLSVQKREAAIARRLLAACEGNTKINSRPSIESNLHAFLDRYVIHLHPVAIGAFINSKNGKTELEKLFAGEKFPLLWVSYANPGYSLAQKIANLTARYRKKYKRLPQVLFLEKHGLFISASTAKKSLQLVRQVIKRCETKVLNPAPRLRGGKLRVSGANRQKTIKKSKQIIRDAFFKASGKKQAVHFFHNKIISAFANRAETGRLLKSGPLNPQEIIYCNGPAIWLEKTQNNKIMPHLKKRRLPAAFLVKNVGLFVIGGAKAALTAKQVVCGSLPARYNAQRFGGIVALTKSEQAFIRNSGG